MKIPFFKKSTKEGGVGLWGTEPMSSQMGWANLRQYDDDLLAETFLAAAAAAATAALCVWVVVFVTTTFDMFLMFQCVAVAIIHMWPFLSNKLSIAHL